MKFWGSESDRDWDAWVHQHDQGSPTVEIPYCADCGEEIARTAYSTPPRVLCRECYQWRAERGLEFDDRPLSVIRASQTQGAA